MIRLPLAFALAAVMALPTMAQEEPMIEGLWMGQGEGELTVDLKHLDGEVYAVSINTLVPIENDMPGCAGGIDGEMIMSKRGGNFFFENEDYEEGSTSPMLGERYCEIGIVLDGKGGMVLEERNGCLAYHGASCGFTGELSHEAAGL